MKRTPRHELATRRAGDHGADLDSLIREWRAAFVSWQAIVRLLRNGYGIETSVWSLHRWYDDDGAPRAEPEDVAS